LAIEDLCGALPATSLPATPAHIHQYVNDLPVPAMRDILKFLNDHSAGHLRIASQAVV
jgi:hypothetical protein